MSFTYKQKLHAIGQGLFYSSSLLNDYDNTQANIVFDCGSDNIDFITREVNEYKKEVSKIDLLIISHLHYDHVSGLDELLKNITVKNIVLPYLNKYERMLLQIKNGRKSQWYSSFLENPYSWLNERITDTNIIVINGNDENPSSNDDNISNLSPSDNFNIENHLSKINSSITEQIEKDEKITFENKLALYQTKGYIQIANLYFKFFNYQVNKKELTAFNSEIQKLSIKDTKSILDILKDGTRRKDLEKVYKQIEKYDLNKTSLVVYQGFIFQKDRNTISFKTTNTYYNYPMLFDTSCCNDDCFNRLYFHKHGFSCDFHCYCSHNNCKNILGTLLLGDIKLDYKTKRKDEFFNYFSGLLKTVQLVQLSHHGANNGWNDNLINKIPQSCLYIASHAVKNKYMHPHKEVLITLARNQRKYISVTEYDEYFLNFCIQ